MAVEKKKVIGMVAYHCHSKSRCEMKRLYVKPKYRENKLGKKLVLEILEYAKKAGYIGNGVGYDYSFTSQLFSFIKK